MNTIHPLKQPGNGLRRMLRWILVVFLLASTLPVVSTQGYMPRATSSTAASGTTELWLPTSLVSAPEARAMHTAVWTGSEMVIWGGEAKGTFFDNGGRYDPSGDAWRAMPTLHAPEARSGHTAVWTGSEMIVWGGKNNTGVLNTGGRYNPSTNTWGPISTKNAPEARGEHTAVWTGSEMIIWGGAGSGGFLDTGGRYDPAADTWTAIPTAGAPEARKGHTAVWTGSEMVIWGGDNSQYAQLNTGGRYSPADNSWQATSIPISPLIPFLGRACHTAVWTGEAMIILGGGWCGSMPSNTYYDYGWRYHPLTDTWTITAPANSVSMQSAVWTGSETIVWGGILFRFTSTDTGGRYNPTTDRWTSTTTTNVPLRRVYHTAVWTGTQMIVWGGIANGAGYENVPLNTGGRYWLLTPSIYLPVISG